MFPWSAAKTAVHERFLLPSFRQKKLSKKPLRKSKSKIRFRRIVPNEVIKPWIAVTPKHFDILGQNRNLLRWNSFIPRKVKMRAIFFRDENVFIGLRNSHRSKDCHWMWSVSERTAKKLHSKFLFIKFCRKLCCYSNCFTRSGRAVSSYWNLSNEWFLNYQWLGSLWYRNY